MKKTLLIILLMLITLSINAQVQRNILGLTLGVTTKESAKKIFKQKKMPIIALQDYKNMYGNESRFTFGGVLFETILITFVNNKVALISMSIQGTNDDDLKDTYNTIINNIREKYKFDNEAIIDEKTDTYTFNIYDNKTFCTCEINSENLLYLTYFDIRLLDANNQKMINEYQYLLINE